MHNNNSRMNNGLTLPNIAKRNLAARTPLIMPKIAMKNGTVSTNVVFPLKSPCKTLQKNAKDAKDAKDGKDGKATTDDDPWIYKKDNKNDDVKMTSITPLGKISEVPTGSKHKNKNKILMTPSRSAIRQIQKGNYNNMREKEKEKGSERDIDESFDALLKATVYIDLDKDYEKYDFMAQKMRSIASGTLNLQKHFRNELKELVQISGYVNEECFEKVLEIYENNQVFYQEKLEDGEMSVDMAKEKLTELERWFVCIIEPKPKSNSEVPDWILREEYKLNTGYSSYCDKELYCYITPISDHVKNYVRRCHRQKF